MEHYDLMENGFLFFSGHQVQQYGSQMLILVILFFVTVSIGALARWFFIHYLIQLGEYVLENIPFINTIYKLSQDVIKTLFSSDSNSFKQVVMAPFPSEKTYSIGLVTQEHIAGFTSNPNQHYVGVFIPTTPNPTSGFLMMFRKEDLVYLDMSVETAMKYIISCGVINTPIKALVK